MKNSPSKPSAGDAGAASAVVLDWCGPFAERVMSRLHEYDDAWPRMSRPGQVVEFRPPVVIEEGCDAASSGMWIVTGEAADVRRSAERGNILGALEEAVEPMAPNVIADVTGMKGGNVRRLLHSMQKAGEVQKNGRGQYVRSGWASE